MTILLDTHILLWWLMGDEKLPQKAKELLSEENNELYYSVVSAFEMEMKSLAHPGNICLPLERVLEYCRKSGIRRLPLEERHILHLRTLRRPEEAPPHKDPFDRILICQAAVENMRFLTHDTLLPFYEEPCIQVV